MSSINLNSDLTLNAQKFSPASIPLKTQLDLKALKFDADTLDKLSTGLLAGLLPKNWYEVSKNRLLTQPLTLKPPGRLENRLNRSSPNPR